MRPRAPDLRHEAANVGDITKMLQLVRIDDRVHGLDLLGGDLQHEDAGDLAAVHAGHRPGLAVDEHRFDGRAELIRLPEQAHEQPQDLVHADEGAGDRGGLAAAGGVPPASSAAAKRDLGWAPKYASWRDGFRAELGG